jgi:DNA-binding beta-propeller fold protein YncE
MADGISGIGVNPITHRIYVAHDLSIISVIDGMVGSPTENTVIATISVPGRDFPSIRGIAVDTTANRIYVPSFDPGGRVVVIDGLTNAVSQISVPSNPIITAINPTTNRIYVGHGSFFLRTQLTVIDGANNGVSDGAAVGLNQSGVGVNPDTNRIYVSKGDPSRDEPFAIVVVDGNTDAVLADIPVATAGPLGVNPTAKRLYVNGGDNNIFIIDISPGSPTENTIVANIAVGSAPFGIGVNPITNRIYVANTGSNTISVIADFTAGSKVAGP